MTIAQALYEEFSVDPNSIGYKIGNGIPFQKKLDMINERRAEILVTRISTDVESGPGKIQEDLAVQEMRDAIVKKEWDANCSPATADTVVVQQQKAALRDWILMLFGGMDGSSNIRFTDKLKAQILGTFSNAKWPDTRANLIEIQKRSGSRAEQLFGSPIAPLSIEDMRSAQEYAETNELPSLYE
jgi:hypothetical protein